MGSKYFPVALYGPKEINHPKSILRPGQTFLVHYGNEKTNKKEAMVVSGEFRGSILKNEGIQWTDCHVSI